MTVFQLTNPQYWESLFSDPLHILINFLDVALVALLLYQFIKAVAGTKLMILIRGVLLFVLVQVLANTIGLTTISWLMSQVITYGVIAAVILFAPEIRTVLERLGRATEFFSSSNSLSNEEILINAFIKSVEYMSPRKIGALISIEGARTLQEYVATGIPLNADVTGELLINIFIPNTPLHDGAVVIQGNKVAAACAYLPLTESTGISKEFGTRHRAAIGLSEVTDALTLVVSEETGGISITHNGVFKHDLSLEDLRSELEKFLIKEDSKKESVWSKLLGGRFS